MLTNTALSDENKCAIHESFSSNDAWPYDWNESCEDDDGPPECILDCPGIDEAGEPLNPGFCEWFTGIEGDACFDDCDENIMEELDELLADCEEC